MIKNQETKKYATDKIAFFGLFFLTVVIAAIIVEARHNKPLEAGIDIIENVKLNGIASYLQNKNAQQYFVVKNLTGQPFGFTAEQFNLSGPTTQPLIDLKSLIYIKGSQAQHQIAFFKGDNNIDFYEWNYRAVGMVGKKSIDISLDENQILTITELGPRPEETRLKLNSYAIPDMYLDFVLKQMVKSKHKKIIIDVIQIDGQIAPILITKMEYPAQNGDEKAGHVLELRLLDSSGFIQRVFIDPHGDITKKVLPREKIIMEHTDINTILRQFPGQSQYLLKNMETSEQN